LLNARQTLVLSRLGFPQVCAREFLARTRSKKNPGF